MLGIIGKANSKTIPYPEKEEDFDKTYEHIANYLNIVNLIKNGIHRNKTGRGADKVQIGSMQRNLTPIFDTQGRLRACLEPRTIRRLIHTYKTRTDHSNTDSIRKGIETLVEIHHLSSVSAGWKLDYKILKMISKEFCLTTEHYKNPFTHDTAFQKYTSTYKEDQDYGAQYMAYDDLWTENGFVNGIITKRKIQEKIGRAMRSAQNNIDTVLVLPDGEDKEHRQDNRGPFLHKIMTWDEGVTLTSTINDRKTKTITTKTHLYVATNTKQMYSSNKFKTLITQASLELYGYIPTYYMPTRERENKERKEYNKKQERAHITKPHQIEIGKYMLKNTLLALKMKNVERMMKKIRRILREDLPEIEIENTKGRIMERDVIKTKKQLNKAIICMLDKNEGHLYVECPMVQKERLLENVERCENFEERQGHTTKHILEGIRTEYLRTKLDKISRWTKGTLPYVYANPKDKDPINKTRIIASYYNHPLKRLYQLASTAGTWLFRGLPSRYEHFTLHKVSDIKSRLQEGIKVINNTYKQDTKILSFQTDVKQMYTFL